MKDGYFNNKLKPKKCKQCGERFEPYTSLSQCCSVKCSLAYNKVKKELAEKKEWDLKKRGIQERLMSYSDWLNKLQKVFNEYIRVRDKDQPCISCGTTKQDIQYHAGHYYSVGAHPNLRFDEDNVHKQCGNNCNKNKHGNVLEYGLMLPIRIGQERYFALFERRKEPLKLSIPEIKVKIKEYKDKIKLLNQKA